MCPQNVSSVAFLYAAINSFHLSSFKLIQANSTYQDIFALPAIQLSCYTKAVIISISDTKVFQHNTKCVHMKGVTLVHMANHKVVQTHWQQKS